MVSVTSHANMRCSTILSFLETDTVHEYIVWASPGVPAVSGQCWVCGIWQNCLFLEDVYCGCFMNMWTVVVSWMSTVVVSWICLLRLFHEYVNCGCFMNMWTVVVSRICLLWLFHEWVYCDCFIKMWTVVVSWICLLWLFYECVYCGSTVGQRSHCCPCRIA